SWKRFPTKRIDRNGRRAARDPRPAEVSVALGFGRHERSTRRPTILQVPLDVAEKVQLVLDQRTAKRRAEIVPPQFLLRLVGFLEEVVLLVQRVVAAGVEHAPVEPVGAAARDDVDLGAAGAAELWSVAVAQDLELFDRFERRIHEDR